MAVAWKQSFWCGAGLSFTRKAQYIWPRFHQFIFLAGCVDHEFIELTDVAIRAITAINLDEVAEIEAIAAEPATVTRLTFEDGQVGLVHETIVEIMTLARMAVERMAPTTALH